MGKGIFALNLETTPNGITILRPNWTVPTHVNAFISTRLGGVSQGSYAGLNLGLHVGDQHAFVMENRSMVSQLLPANPMWLNQVHGIEVASPSRPLQQADGSVTGAPNQVLTIMTADCMPVLFCDDVGDILAACHAGWRGMALGVIQATLQHMIQLKKPDDSKSFLEKMRVYLGPTIGPDHFVVGQEVMAAFLPSIPTQQVQNCFVPTQNPNQFLADLFQIARLILHQHGIRLIDSDEICSYTNERIFFSHRRDKTTGRFASFLWKAE